VERFPGVGTGRSDVSDARELGLLVIARAQHGVFTLTQALACGYSRATVRRRIDGRAWDEIAPRVYRVALAADADWRARTLAMALSTGGVACERSALALYGLWNAPGCPEVLVTRGARTATRLPQRSTDSLPTRDVTQVDRIPVTTPVRTLIDMGGRLPLSLFEDVLDTAIVQRLVRVERLQERANELWAPRRNGCAVVLALLEQRHPELRRARNVWEARTLRIVRAAGLPDPRVNYRVQVGGKRRYLDLAWPAAKVAVEFDGFVPHSTRRVFDDDRARQNDLVADGWTVFRITKTMLDSDPTATFRPIAVAVAAKR
jgi:very-short-patch-repair endonuclease